MWRVRGSFYCFDSKEQLFDPQTGRELADSIMEIPKSIMLSDSEMEAAKALRSPRPDGRGFMQPSDMAAGEALDRMVESKIQALPECEGKFVIVKHPYWYENV